MGFLVLLAVGSVVFYACFVRLRLGRYEVVRDRLRVEPSRVLKVIPAITLVCHSSLPPEEEKARRPLATLPWLHVRYADDDPARVSVHEDDAYVKRFGWLTAHYRRTRWWFFAWWFGYQVVRAALLGAAVASPMAQVFGLLLIEVVAFIVTARLQPFEGSRNAAAAVWLLGISKVATAGLSIGFLPAFGLGGIPSTALAIIVVLIQLVLVAAVLVLIILGVISSWMSLTRDRESFPASLASRRATFLAKVERRAADVPEPVKTASSEPEEEQKPIVPYFSVNSVRREPKIGETLGRLSDRYSMNNGSGVFLVAPGGIGSRPVSLSSRHSVSSLRRAALVHPGSRSTVDLALPPPEPPMRPAERPDSSRLRRQMSPPLEAPEDQGAALERVQARAFDDKEVRRSVRWQ
ncbi:unnamed protein product [Parascedosporium putredinis]|uniref:TRP C-terminal domain-containing protein n=1 Tax=Parascedosporium putredinis TaxID=1442378 RepID=A0A9P1GVV2_9PEZI|nr:unnamed protein product [Parascedosporium putredinis]CAI7988043.1 unnamed protein product [Parascedosporium putredinis]